MQVAEPQAVMEFEFRVTEMRKRRGLSQRRLSELEGLSHSYIQALEERRIDNPTLKRLGAVAEALDCNLYDILIPKR